MKRRLPVKRAKTLSQPRPRRASRPRTPFPKFPEEPWERSRALLLSVFTRREREQFLNYDYVDIRGRSGYRYRLHANGYKQVFYPAKCGSRSKWFAKAAMCVSLKPEWISFYHTPPIFDDILAVLLHIKTDEATLLKIAKLR